MNDAASRSVRDCVGAAGGVELFQQRGDMEFRGVDGYSELLGNRLVRGAFRQQGEDVEFARRQVEAVRFSSGV